LSAQHLNVELVRLLKHMSVAKETDHNVQVRREILIKQFNLVLLLY